MNDFYDTDFPEELRELARPVPAGWYRATVARQTIKEIASSVGTGISFGLVLRCDGDAPQQIEMRLYQSHSWPGIVARDMRALLAWAKAVGAGGADLRSTTIDIADKTEAAGGVLVQLAVRRDHWGIEHFNLVQVLSRSEMGPQPSEASDPVEGADEW